MYALGLGGFISCHILVAFLITVIVAVKVHVALYSFVGRKGHVPTPQAANYQKTKTKNLQTFQQSEKKKGKGGRDK